MTLAHRAGAGMNHDFMVTVSKKLAEKDIATLRFNFPFMENKQGRPNQSLMQKELFFGFPLHQSGKPSIERAEHLKRVKVPMLFLQGSRDELASYDLIEQVCASLRSATLIKIEGANHTFKAGKQEIVPMLADYNKQ